MSNLVHQSGDDYPLILFEPTMGSKYSLKTLAQADKSLHFFSEFKIALTFLQSLCSSFFMITPIDLDEQRLIQDFSCLKDTYAERLCDFEEESLLAELLKNSPDFTIKSLRVHFFYSKKDFENNAIQNDEEEEVMLMCNVDEMVKQFREDFAIFWCDPLLTLGKKELLEKEFGIDEKNIYTKFEDLLKRIENYNGPPYHLILSGQTQTEKITSNLNQYKDMLSCYIYESPPHQSHKKEKNVKIQKTLEKLLPQIKEGIRTKSKNRNTLPAFATHFDDRDKSHINKVHYYLRGFVNFRNRKQAQTDFMNLAKKIYQSEKLFTFENKYFEYDKDKVLNWYTQESPIYKIVNNALRISSSDSILYCRFLLKDLERAIREEYHQDPNKFSGEVYRGTYISKQELEKLEANVGKEIEMYGFLSTSTNIDTALKFYQTNDVDNKILVTIIVPPSPGPEIDEHGFANISKLSKHPDEKEILFNVKSRFQILEVGTKEIKSTQYKHLVLLYGPQLLRKYVTIQQPFISLGFSLPEERKCKSCSSENSLFVFHKENTQIICKSCLLQYPSKNVFFWPLSKNQSESDIKVEFRGKILEYSHRSSTSADFYGYKCNDCSNSRQEERTIYYKMIDPKTNIVRIQCSACLEGLQEFSDNLILSESSSYTFWQSKQEGWEEIDTHFKTKEFEMDKEMKGVDVFHKTQEYEKSRELSIKALKYFAHKRKRKRIIVEFYESLGKSFHSLGEYKKALEYHLRTLNLRKFLLGEIHPLTSTSYHDVAEAYKSLAEHQKALEYYRKALDIRKQVFEGEAHFSIADSYNALAEIYNAFGEYQNALEHHQKALTITETFFGTETHPKSANSYHNIALVHYKLGKYEKALQDHQKALDIRKSVYGEIHSETATSYNNIAEAYRGLAKHKEATDCFTKSLDIRKSIFIDERHPSTAESYASIASLYRSLSKHQESVEYHEKALDIRIKIFGKKHPSIADSLSNLALVLNDLGQHRRALEYHQEALNIIKLIYGETHTDIAILCNNLAGGYKHLGDYKNAREYHEKALNISESIFGEMHPLTATSFNNLGLIYNHLGEYEKALAYHTKALDIRNRIYKEAHPHIADSYNNLASVYYNQGKYDKVLEYYFKALDIAKLVYGEVHISIADFYDNIGLCYDESLGEHKKALEFFKKALTIKNSIYQVKMHPSFAESYCCLALVYRNLGRYKRALKFERKALYIRRFIFGERHPDTASSHNTFALTLSDLGKYQKATKHYLKALNVRKSVYGEEHSLTADSYSNLAIVYSDMGKHKKALKLHLQALHIRTSVHGEVHPDTIESLMNLATTYKNLEDFQEASKYSKKVEFCQKKSQNINKIQLKSKLSSMFACIVKLSKLIVQLVKVFLYNSYNQYKISKL